MENAPPPPPAGGSGDTICRIAWLPGGQQTMRPEDKVELSNQDQLFGFIVAHLMGDDADPARASFVVDGLQRDAWQKVYDAFAQATEVAKRPWATTPAQFQAIYETSPVIHAREPRPSRGPSESRPSTRAGSAPLSGRILRWARSSAPWASRSASSRARSRGTPWCPWRSRATARATASGCRAPRGNRRPSSVQPSILGRVAVDSAPRWTEALLLACLRRASRIAREEAALKL